MKHIVELKINGLAQDPSTPPELLVAEILELATIAREHMGDRDRAAELLHQALGVMPTHEEALARYVAKIQEGTDVRLYAAQELARSDLKSGRYGSLMPFDIIITLAPPSTASRTARCSRASRRTRSLVTRARSPLPPTPTGAT